MVSQNKIYQTVSYGSSGADVEKVQTLLNQNGYNLTVDGIFGKKTEAAVEDFQQKNGLVVGGIVGEKTTASLTSGSSPSTSTSGSSPSTSTSGSSSSTTSTTNQPFTYKDFDYDNFTYDDYKESQAVTDAGNALNTHLANKPSEYQSQWQTQLDELMKSIMNRDKFSYNFNEDALYQQYKDKFIQQGKMAMGDAIGQASAMTGGYGNSYAQSVGQQAYQAQLQNLNDVIPELYQMALDKYNMEGQDLYNQYGMVMDRENLDYSRYRDTVSDYLTERDYLAGRYDSERDYDYSKYVDDRNFDYGKYSDDRSLAYDKYSTDKSLAYQEYRNAIDDAFAREQFDYQKERDRITDQQWQKQYDALYGDKKTTTSTSNNSTVKQSSNPSDISPSLGSDVDPYVDTSGNTTGGNTQTGAVPEEIRTKAKTFTDNNALNDYLTKQYNAGKITKEQMGELYLEYEVPTLSNRNWTAGKDGGINWFGGVDNNATVKDQYGNEYRLDKLVDALAAEGMSKSDAKAYVKKLQGQLGL